MAGCQTARGDGDCVDATERTLQGDGVEEVLDCGVWGDVGQVEAAGVGGVDLGGLVMRVGRVAFVVS